MTPQQLFAEVSEITLAIFYYFLCLSAILVHYRIRRKFKWFRQLWMLTASYCILCFSKNPCFLDTWHPLSLQCVAPFLSLKLSNCSRKSACLYLLQISSCTSPPYLYSRSTCCAWYSGRGKRGIHWPDWTEKRAELYTRSFALDGLTPLLPNERSCAKWGLKSTILVCGLLIAAAFIGIIIWDGFLVLDTTVCSLPEIYNAAGDAYVGLSALLHAVCAPMTVVFMYFK